MRLPLWYVQVADWRPLLGAYYAASTRNEARSIAAIEIRDSYPLVRYTDLRARRCHDANGTPLTVEVCCPRPLFTYEVTGGRGASPTVEIHPTAEADARRWRLGQYEARQRAKATKAGGAE